MLATEPTSEVRSAAVRQAAASTGVPARELRRLVRQMEATDATPTWARVLAVGLLVVLAGGPHLKMEIPSVLPLEVATLPLWWPTAARSRWFPALMALVGFALASGLWLSVWNGDDHAWSHRNAVATSTLVLAVFLGVGVVLWSRTVLGLRGTGLAFTFGAFVNAAQSVGSGLAAQNPWKFAWSLPVALLILSLTVRMRSRLLQAALLAALGASGAANDARSFFGFCLITAGLVIWQGLPRGESTPLQKVSPVLLIGGLLALAYWGGTKLLLSGALGQGLQERSQAQVVKSGSLLAGGRPEWTASWQLMHERPFGFGLGSVPTSQDIFVGKTGLSSVLQDYNNGYVDHFMFGGAFKLHSVTADLWVSLGLAGLLLALAVAAVLIASLSRALAERRAVALVTFCTVVALWFLLFGPIVSNLGFIGVAVGLALPLSDAAKGAT